MTLLGSFIIEPQIHPSTFLPVFYQKASDKDIDYNPEYETSYLKCRRLHERRPIAQDHSCHG
jgi:hypothetical protein